MPLWNLRIELSITSFILKQLGLENRPAGMETGLTLLSIWWGLVTVLYPAFIHTTLFDQAWRQTVGYPQAVACLSILFGSMQLVALKRGYKLMRYLSSIATLCIWLWLTYRFQVARLPGGIACYSAFAFGNILILMRMHVEAHGMVDSSEQEFLLSQIQACKADKLSK